MNADLPIKDKDEDAFGYAPFAASVAPNLVLRPGNSSLIAGVEAPWGSGKTSFLNLTRQALQRNRNNPLIVDYVPWLYSTIDSLLLGFCTQLSNQLRVSGGKKFEAIGTALDEFSAALSPLTGIDDHTVALMAARISLSTVGRLLRRFGKAKKIDLSNAREKVQHAITAFGRPIIIFIDDVDRLAPSETRLLFQFIKAVAAFDGVSYLIAYDPEAVQKALSFDDRFDGSEYLKKFIQLPIRLPRISNLLLQRYFRRAVEGVANAAEPRLSQDDKKVLAGCIAVPEVLRVLRTPRDVVRCLNLFQVRLPDCRGELALNDLLLFVLVELIDINAIDLVRRHPGFFLDEFTQHPEFDDAVKGDLDDSIFAEAKERDEKKKLILQTIKQGRRELVTPLLQKLFANERGAFTADVRKAGSVQGLIKLLYGGGSPLSFSVKEVDEFLLNQSRQDIIEDKINAGALPQWIVFANSIYGPKRIINPESFIDVLVDASLRVEDVDPIRSIHRLVAEFIRDLVGQIPASQAAVVLQAVVSQTKNLTISEDVILRLASDAGLWCDGQSLPIDARAKSQKWTGTPSLETIVALERQWVAKVKECAAAERLHLQPRVESILYRWGQFSGNDYTEPQDYLREFSKTHDPLLILQKFPIGLSIKGMEKLVSNPSELKRALDRYSSEGQLREQAKKAMIGLEVAAKTKLPPRDADTTA